jgi:hypothetical protein
MRRLVFFVLLTFAGAAVAGDLWPSLKTGRSRLLLILGGLLSVAAWALPLAFGHGIHDAIPIIGGPLKVAGSAWFVTAALITVIGAPFLLLRSVTNKVSKAADAPADPSRRVFLTSVGKTIPVAAAATGVVGVVSGSLPFKLKKETIKLKGLPPALDGFRIGQLTDVHVGAFVSPADVRRAVAMLDEEGVDLQVMTGDLIDDLDGMEETFDALGSCRAQHGMVAIYGNHEHWRGISAIRRQYDRLVTEGRPVKLLVDSTHQIVHQGQALRVVGVDYPFSAMGRDVGMQSSADRAFAGVSREETTLCLSHHPGFFPLASQRGARLTLSGHTHGGQVALLGIPVFSIVFRYILGRYRDGDNHLYVSGGTGHWMPFRIGIPAEVTVLTLKAA